MNCIDKEILEDLEDIGYCRRKRGSGESSRSKNVE